METGNSSTDFCKIPRFVCKFHECTKISCLRFQIPELKPSINFCPIWLILCPCIGLQQRFLTIDRDIESLLKLESLLILESGIKDKKSTYCTYICGILQHFQIQTWNFTEIRGATLQNSVEFYKPKIQNTI